MAENNPDTGLSTEERLLGFLDADPSMGSQADEADEIPKKPVEDEEEPKADEAEESDTEETEEADEEEPEEEELAEGEDEVFELELPDGSTEEVTLKELRDGRLRQADYTRKTQEVANQRRELEQQSQLVNQARMELVQQIEAFKSQDEARLEALNKTNWEELKQYDLEEYLTKKAEKADLTDRINQAKQDQQKLAQEQQEAFVKQFNDYKTQADAVLRSEQGIPGWGDEKEMPKIRKALKETGLQLGFSEEELQMAVDPRALKALWMASKFVKSEMAGKKAQAKIKRKVPTVSKPGASKVKKTGNKNTEHLKRLRQTGSMDDGARALFDLLDDD